MERFVEHVLRDQTAGKEQIEDHKRVDELHAADMDLADGVGHGGGDQHGKRGCQNRLDGGDEQTVCIDLGAENLNIVLQIDALEPEHQTALDVFLIRHDRRDQAVPERVKAKQAERDAEDRHGHVVEVKAQPHEHAAAQGSGFLFHARPSFQKMPMISSLETNLLVISTTIRPRTCRTRLIAVESSKEVPPPRLMR